MLIKRLLWTGGIKKAHRAKVCKSKDEGGFRLKNIALLTMFQISNIFGPYYLLEIILYRLNGFVLIC